MTKTSSTRGSAFPSCGKMGPHSMWSSKICMSWCAFCMWCIGWFMGWMKRKRMSWLDKGNPRHTCPCIRCSSLRWRSAIRDGCLTWAKDSSYTTLFIKRLSSVSGWLSTAFSTTWLGGTTNSTTFLAQCIAVVQTVIDKWLVKNGSSTLLDRSDNSILRFRQRSWWMVETSTICLIRYQIIQGKFIVIWRRMGMRCWSFVTSDSIQKRSFREEYLRCRWTRG